MVTSTCVDATMRTSVGMLVLGLLSEVERRDVATHLDHCASCRAEREEIDHTVDTLGLLGAAHVRRLIADFGAVPAGPDRTPPGDHLFGAPGAAPARERPARAEAPVVIVRETHAVPRLGVPDDVHPVNQARPATATDRYRAGPGEGFLPPRPATGPLSRGPHSHRRPRSRRRRIGGVVGVTGLLAVALSTTLLIEPWKATDSPGPVVAVAATDDGVSGVEFSAVLYDDDGQVNLRVSTDGLAPDASYQLWALTTAGEELLLGRLNGTPGRGGYAGDVAVSVDDLSQLSVRQVDGGVLVTAEVVKGSPRPDGAPDPT
ncbi:zf-HC2 domain-containing protein [Micromonospora sp. NPDC048935]|uniref:zf-HC2 domain-containing protein n=1 Tax=Micromonospora sp. NPDC048935 TaxID=3364262 RepID=UPI0037130172